MKIAIMGAGGIGGYYGGKLAAAGEDVTFIARGAHLDALRNQGLRVESAGGDFHVQQVQATDNPATVGPVELVIVTTKTYDLEAAAEAIGPLVGPDTVVLPLLNGVDIAERIAAALGRGRVLGGLCYVSSAIVAPGVIRQRGPLDRVVLGELAGGRSPQAEAVLAACQRASINAELSEHVLRDIWSKFLFIDAASGVCALTGATLGPVLGDADTRALYVECLEEVAAVARALDIGLADDAVQKTLALSDGLPAETKPSMLLDVEQGRRLEVEALNGTLARLAAEQVVAAPVNRFIHAALKLRAGGTPRA